MSGVPISGIPDYLGIRVTEVGPGTMTAELEVRRELLNPFGSAPGGGTRATLRRRVRPRDPMRDYIGALPTHFAAFRTGSGLHYDGEFWKLSLLPTMWSPGPIDVPDPPVDVAAVNPWMLRMAGAVADGVHVHPLNTPTYLNRTVLPNLEQGSSRAGRSLADLDLIVPALVAPGSTPDEVSEWREAARIQVAFYGSTPNYAFIFDQLGREGTTARIRECQKAGDLDGMAAQIDDELLDHFCVSGHWDTVTISWPIATRGSPPVWSSISPAPDGPGTRRRSVLGVSWPEPSDNRAGDQTPLLVFPRARPSLFRCRSTLGIRRLRSPIMAVDPRRCCNSKLHIARSARLLGVRGGCTGLHQGLFPHLPGPDPCEFDSREQ